eukprot:GSChrysophyteH1.ASY1.ANO1.2982.1 assembled CDS
MRAQARAMSSFKRVGIVGIGGLMGHGVAQVTAAAGYDVLGIESQQSALDAGVKRIDDSLSKVIKRNVSKGVYDEAAGVAKKAEIMGRIQTSLNLEDVNSCDLIIEAIPENMNLKLSFYENLGQLVSNKDVVFASNTSSLQITAMAEASGRPENFLVEVIKTDHTSKATFDAMTEFGQKIGKTTVSCNDTPGFIVNRLLVPYLAQALAMVDRGDASIPDIDVSMQLGAGHPMGPVHLADYIGLDTTHSILVGWQDDFPDEKAFFMPKCLDEKVKAGDLGRKTGKGFYHWDGEKRGDLVV